MALGAGEPPDGQAQLCVHWVPAPLLSKSKQNFEAYELFKPNNEGKSSEIYPAFARVPTDLFGICVVATSGEVYAIGNTDYVSLGSLKARS
jgi:glutaminase